MFFSFKIFSLTLCLPPPPNPGIQRRSGCLRVEVAALFLNLPIPEDVCIPHPGFRWGHRTRVGTFPSLEGYSSSIHGLEFALVTIAIFEDTVARFWTLMLGHFPGSALCDQAKGWSLEWLCCVLLFSPRAVSIEALQICGHTAYEVGMNSAAALPSTPRSRLRPLMSFPIHFLLMHLADPGQSLRSCG